MTTTAELPALDGVRVLDFSRVMSGPYATGILADHGADVVKIEGLPLGDSSRNFGVDFVGDQSAVFLMWNRGKRSIALDLRKPESIAVIDRLVAHADVLVENYRPGIAESIGLGFERLSALNPRLVYCSLTAFGPVGPLASMPGTDPVVQAASGVMSVTGESGGDPLMVGVPIADFAAAMASVQGILFALLARERTGLGQRVDVSMLFAMLSTLTTRLASYWSTGQNPTRSGSAHSVLTPYQVFPTADGSVMAGAWRPESWVSFCNAIDMPELAADERFATNVQRQAHRDELIPVLREAFVTRTSDEWEARFSGAGALFARVNTFADILEHAHVIDSGMIRSVEHPTLGPVRQLASPIAMSATPPRIELPPPLLGQHTREVLHEAGYTTDEIDHLHRIGAAATTDVPETDTMNRTP